MAVIQEKGYKLATPIVATNADDFKDSFILATGNVSAQNDIIKVEA